MIKTLARENLNGTTTLNQQNFQTPSHFTNEEIVTTIPVTTQQGISFLHHTNTKLQNKIASAIVITINSYTYFWFKFIDTL